MLRGLPRYATDLRVHGIIDPPSFGRFGFAPPVFPQNHPGGNDSGGGGGSGSTGGDDDADDDDGDEGTGRKALADMTDAEKAKFWQRQARQTERKLKGAPKPEDVAKLKEAAAELEKIRDSQRTDSEKAVARADAAEKELGDLKPKLDRLEVALEKGLTLRQAMRLVGSTKDELAADADELLEELGQAARGADEKDEKDKREKRTAARKDAGRDNGPRGDRTDTKATVSSGADLFANRKAKKTAAGASSSASS